MSNPVTFIVSDESINSYGFRVLTGGVNLAQFKRNPIMLYMHNRNRWDTNTTGVIGKWENVRKEGDVLKADAVFDESDEFAKSIKEKVEKGFLRMASVGVRIVERSEDAKYLLPGQTRATVTKSELQEISIVDIGSNANALKLYGDNGDTVQLADALPEMKLSINSNLDTNMSNLKTIALALKLDADASESEVLKEIGNLQTAKANLADFKQKQETAQQAEAVKLVDKAVEKGIIPAALKDGQLAAFDKDFEGTKKQFETLFDNLEEDTEETQKPNEQLGDFITKLPKSSAKLSKTDDAKTYAWYQENDPQGLVKLQADNPAEFEKLLTEHLK